ncbi:receptor protein kinase-like [Ectocarpus siliculosus]|uniref:Receptor protein kinase-like n=1 Tax=Ectocarpus siliculosus TaxID=2880 RepID=D8LF75_ECTSI|nr:receptor protein kinase-like [Ectocarpus siliculosus]|eukprot:CBN78673.1 receptor protein kinase-like [Ectocarpus siliculosus]
MADVDVWQAARQGLLEDVQEFLYAGGDPNMRDSTYLSPLHNASIGGSPGVVAELLGAGANVNLVNTLGTTPLHSACAHLQPHCVELLLARGGDDQARDFRGKTPADVIGEAVELSEGAEPDDELCEVIRRTLAGGMDLAQDAVQAAEEARNSEDAADSANIGIRDRSRTRSNSSRGIQSHGHGPSDHDARHKVASLTAQLIQKEHRIRGLEQGVQTKVAEVATLQTQLRSSEARIRGLERHVAELMRRVSRAETALAEVSEEHEKNSMTAARATTLFTAEEIRIACDSFSPKKLIGRGSSAEVYQGEMKLKKDQDCQRVAIKRMSPQALQGLQNFQREVKVLMMCLHENIVPLLGIATDPWCLVYPHMSNGSLEDVLATRARRRGLSAEMRVRIALGVAHALDYLHTPWLDKPAIIHRDVKPANILLDSGMNARLGDAGIARVLDAAESNAAATQVQGTLNYIDPGYMRTGTLNDKSDIYSLGVVMVELLLGAVATVGMVNRVRMSLLTQARALADGAIEWTGNTAEKLADIAHGCCIELPAQRSSLRTVHICLEATLGGQGLFVASAAVRTCRICLTAPANTRFIPCFHSIACVDDATNLLRRRGSCPVCREPIESVEEGEFAQTFAPQREREAAPTEADGRGEGQGVAEQKGEGHTEAAAASSVVPAMVN